VAGNRPGGGGTTTTTVAAADPWVNSDPVHASADRLVLAAPVGSVQPVVVTELAAPSSQASALAATGLAQTAQTVPAAGCLC